MRALTLLAAVLALTACSSTSPGIYPFPFRQPELLSVSGPGSVAVGEDATFTVTWINGRAPFQITWLFNNGAEPPLVTASGIEQRSSSAVTTITNEDGGSSFSASVQVKDSLDQIEVLPFTVQVEP